MAKICYVKNDITKNRPSIDQKRSFSLGGISPLGASAFCILECARWQNRAFLYSGQEGIWPLRTVRSFRGGEILVEEILELVQTPEAPGGMADVAISLLGLAACAEVDLWTAIRDKWELVRSRPMSYWRGRNRKGGQR